MISLKILALTSMLFSLLYTQSSFATLDDSEVESLDKTFATYKGSKTIGGLLSSLGPQIDLNTRRFLDEKTKMIRNEKLMRIMSDERSRLIFPMGASSLSVQFISLRSDTFYIDGHELEFQPGEDLESRFNRLIKLLSMNRALQKKDGSNALFKILENLAYAAGTGNSATVDGMRADRVEVVKKNLVSLAAIVMAIQNAAKNGAECGIMWTEANKTCQRSLEEFNDLVPPRLHNDPAPKPEVQGSCSAADVAPLTPKQIEAVKKMEAELPRQKIYYSDEPNMADDSDPFQADSIKKLSKNNVLNLTMKWKVGQINSILSTPPVSTEASCRSSLKECLSEAIGKVRGRTLSRPLKCYMDKVAKDLGKPATNTAPAATAPAAANAPTAIKK
jgi:hypothetical protein